VETGNKLGSYQVHKTILETMCINYLITSLRSKPQQPRLLEIDMAHHQVENSQDVSVRFRITSDMKKVSLKWHVRSIIFCDLSWSDQ
jgi:hypothetical protein